MSVTNVGSFAAPVASVSVPGAAAVVPPVAGQQALPPQQQVVGPTFVPPTEVVIGGGAVDIAKSAVARLASFAQSKMDQVQLDMDNEMKSEGGTIDTAKLQVYNSMMSKYEMMMQLAAKIQDKEERAISVWLRP